jgi:uncharacterized membrane protein
MFLTLLLGLAGFVLLYLLFRKIRRLSEYTDALRSAGETQEKLIAELTGRVFQLEEALRSGNRGTAPTPEVPASTQVEPVPEPETIAAPAPRPAPLREDWEAVVGTSWLNRIGALVLVVGIGLFLGYSLTHLGPAGKVGIGFASGASMLAAGLTLRRRESYLAFSLSLTAGGWALVYFTTYAMHGLQASRVIHSPIAGAAALLAVSAAMLGHALLYRSERATALAFLFGFISLNITAITNFSIVATLCLAASLLVLADRFAWQRLALAGAVLTYSTFLLRYDPAMYSGTSIFNGQAILWTYWAMFEAFDLLDIRRRGLRRGPERSLFLLNICGFIGASLLHGTEMKSGYWATFFAAASVACLVSSLLRARLEHPGEVASRGRTLGSGYEGAAAASAFLMAAAVIRQFSGAGTTIALLMEGELIVLAGIGMQNRYLRWLGGGVLVLPFLHLTGDQIYSNVDGDLGLRLWTPPALLAAGTYVLNRFVLQGPWLYGAGAGILLAVVAAEELPGEWVAAGWAVLALLALAAGEQLRYIDLRLQSCALSFAALARSWLVNLTGDSGTLRIATTSAVIAVFYASEFLVRGGRHGSSEAARRYFSICGTALVTMLLFNEVQGRLLTVAFGIVGALLLMAGFLSGERILRLSGLIVFLLCIGKLFVYDVRELDTISRILSFIFLGIMLLAASWVYTRFRDRIRRLL